LSDAGHGQYKIRRFGLSVVFFSLYSGRKMCPVPEELTIERFEGAVEGQRVLRLAGPLTLATTPQFQNTLRSEDASTMILDLTKVPYIDSVGLGSLVGAYVSWQKAGKQIVLSGINGRVSHLFQVTRLDSFFLSFPTLRDAVGALTNSARA